MLVHRIDHVGNRKVLKQTFFTDKKSSFPQRKYDTPYINWFVIVIKKDLTRNKNNIY